jgi:hypothetical protein
LNLRPLRFIHLKPVALIFVLAPLPNWLFSHCGGDDFTADYEGSGPVDLGRFITSIVVVTGFALPLVLAHSEVIRPGACAMSIIGGSYVAFSCPGAYYTDIRTSDLYMGLSWRTALRSNKRNLNMSNVLCVSLVFESRIHALLRCTLYSVIQRLLPIYPVYLCAYAVIAGLEVFCNLQTSQ